MWGKRCLPSQLDPTKKSRPTIKVGPTEKSDAQTNLFEDARLACVGVAQIAREIERAAMRLRVVVA